MFPASDTLSKIEVLKDRALLFKEVRSFFEERNVLEVDCPIMSSYAPVDRHIDIMQVQSLDGKRKFLHSSTEYAMKRLLSDGIGDIYQMCHVFRDNECGQRHNPEFTMIEWYRTNFSFEAMIEETLDLIRLFLGPLPARILTYREAFSLYADFDYVKATNEEMVNTILSSSIDAVGDLSSWDRDTLLQCIMSFVIEPHLGKEELTVIRNFPSTQAALAKKEQVADEPVAKRYEIYFDGVELANGYDELQEGEEQLQRFIEENKARQAMNKDTLPIDYYFIEALKKGFPDSCGVAVGFDRLMMLRHRAKELKEVLPFYFGNI